MDQNYELNINTNEMCRVCLSESGDMKPIFCIEIVNGGVVPFPKVFESITSIKVKQKDGFPENICSACKTTIRDSYVLKEKCQQNRNLLCSILGITLEVEETKCIPVVPQNPVMITIETQTEKPKDAVVLEACTQTISTKSVGVYTQTVTNKSVGVHTQTAKKMHATNETQTTPPPKIIENDHQQISIIATASNIKLQSTPEHRLELNAGMKVEATEEDDMEVLEIEEEYSTYDEEDRLEYSVLEEDDQYESEERMTIVEYDGDGIQIKSNTENTEDIPYSDGEMEDITTTAEYLLEDEELESVEKVSLFCAVCINEFSTQLEFDQHQPFCDMPPPKRFRTQRSTISQTPKVIRVNSETQDKKPEKFCNVCNHFLTVGSTSYEKHMSCHKQSMPMLIESVYYYRCGGCSIVFITPEQLEAHLNSCEFECADKKPSKLFNNTQILKDRDLMDICQRIYSCTRLDGNLFICDWCADFTDETVIGILDHFTKTHFEDVTADVTHVQSEHYHSFSVPHKCGVCSHVFNTLQETLKHVYHHSTVFVCPYNQCSDSYAKFYLLHQHLERNHMDDMEFGCTHCTAIFTGYGEFRAHLRTECQERTLPCDMCEKKFFSKNTLAIHRKYHFNDKKYSCGYCKKRFTQSGDLKTHERIHTGEKPYKCTVCDKAFRSSGNRKDHMSVHEDEKRFVCSYCDLQCKSERTLRGHMTLHTNTKKFRCDICQKPFHRAYHLKTHMRVHEMES